MRIMAALFVSPFAIVPALMALSIVVNVFGIDSQALYVRDSEDYLVDVAGMVLVFSMFGWSIAFAAAIVLGVPTYLLLHHFGRATEGHCAIVGGAAGVLCGGWMSPYITMYVTTGLCGVCVAAAFCRISGSQRAQA